MSNSTILGKCDMVLAISEDTVNYQFDQLYKRNIIHQKWNIMIFEDEEGKVSKVLVNQSDSDFEAEIAKEEFAYAYTATIGAPTITVLPNERKVLTFSVPFSSGTIYYWVGHGRSSSLKKSDMTGWLYAFKVQIGSIEKDAKDVKWVTQESQDSFAKNCTGAGLNQELFLIQSIFMDFENSNYADYDQSQSHVPTNIEELAIFQNLLSNYFKTLAKTGNPYIFGYGMKLKHIEDKAMFTPTSLRYSTSYDDNAPLRSFNFLMMLDGTDFPSGQDVGILPKSLITTPQSQGSGVLAINFDSFQSKFLQPFITAVHDQIIQGFDSKDYSRSGQQWSLSTSKTNTKNIGSPPSDLFKDTHQVSKVDLTSNITLTNKDGSSLLLENVIEYALNIKIQCWEILHNGYHTEAQFWLSTSGTKDVGPDKEHKGEVGKVDINIKLSTEGKMTVTDSFNTPYLGVEKDPWFGQKGGIGDWAIIQSMWNQDSDESAAEASLKAFNDISTAFGNVKSDVDKAINDINSGKIILPLGKVYSFKNMHLSKSENTNDNPVLFDVTYNPQ